MAAGTGGCRGVVSQSSGGQNRLHPGHHSREVAKRFCWKGTQMSLSPLGQGLPGPENSKPLADQGCSGAESNKARTQAMRKGKEWTGKRSKSLHPPAEWLFTLPGPYHQAAHNGCKEDAGHSKATTQGMGALLSLTRSMSKSPFFKKKCLLQLCGPNN